MNITLDVGVLLDNIWHTTPPKTCIISSTLAELLLKHELHGNLFYIFEETSGPCYRIFPMDEWRLYCAMDKDWALFFESYRSRQEYLTLSPREQKRRDADIQRDKMILELEKARTEAILAGDTKKVGMIELALIMNRKRV